MTMVTFAKRFSGGDRLWHWVARSLYRRGQLATDYGYGELDLSELIAEERQERVGDMEYLVESILAIVNPDGYQQLMDGRSDLPEERGFEKIVYEGESE